MPVIPAKAEKEKKNEQFYFQDGQILISKKKFQSSSQHNQVQQGMLNQSKVKKSNLQQSLSYSSLPSSGRDDNDYLTINNNAQKANAFKLSQQTNLNRHDVMKQLKQQILTYKMKSGKSLANCYYNLDYNQFGTNYFNKTSKIGDKFIKKSTTISPHSSRPTSSQHQKHFQSESGFSSPNFSTGSWWNKGYKSSRRNNLNYNQQFDSYQLHVDQVRQFIRYHFRAKEITVKIQAQESNNMKSTWECAKLESIEYSEKLYQSTRSQNKQSNISNFLHSTDFYKVSKRKPNFEQLMQEKDEILNSDDDSNSCIQDHIRFKVPKEKKKVWDFFQSDQHNSINKNCRRNQNKDSYDQPNNNSSDQVGSDSSLSQVSTQYYDSKITQYTAENVARKKKLQAYKGVQVLNKRPQII